LPSIIGKIIAYLQITKFNNLPFFHNDLSSTEALPNGLRYWQVGVLRLAVERGKTQSQKNA